MASNVHIVNNTTLVITLPLSIRVTVLERGCGQRACEAGVENDVGTTRKQIASEPNKKLPAAVISGGRSLDVSAALLKWLSRGQIDS